MTQLRQIMLEELERRNYAQSTIHTYIRTVEHYSRHFHRSPDQLSLEHVREYQAAMFRTWKLAPNTVAQRLAALRFLYIQVLKRGWSAAETLYPKKVLHLPEILTQAEVARLIAHFSSIALLGDLSPKDHRTATTIRDALLQIRTECIYLAGKFAVSAFAKNATGDPSLYSAQAETKARRCLRLALATIHKLFHALVEVDPPLPILRLSLECRCPCGFWLAEHRRICIFAPEGFAHFSYNAAVSFEQGNKRLK